ncbi:MAG: alpha/beta hydrolase [Chloroflexi bacterium]|nr:alpha/beta hydrolase [Chloroflexota bacterium]
MPEIYYPIKNKSDADILYFLDPNPGGAPVVLLLHGLGVSSESWQLQIPSLVEAGFRPIAPDVPGFGRSTCQGVWSIRRSGKRMTWLLGKLGIERAVLVGISMGGVLALQMALDDPQMVDRLVLVNAFARLRSGHWQEWPYYLRRYMTLTLRGIGPQAEIVAQRLFPRPEQEELRCALIAQILQGDERVYMAAMRSLGLFDVQKRLDELHLPTLVITGEEDTTVPIAAQRAMAQKIAGASQIIVPGAGHGVTVDQPEIFNQHLLEFLHPTGRPDPEHA